METEDQFNIECHTLLAGVFVDKENAVEPRVDILDICLNHRWKVRDKSKSLRTSRSWRWRKSCCRAIVQATEIVYAGWLDDAGEKNAERSCCRQ